jgi:hypothetical protein
MEKNKKTFIGLVNGDILSIKSDEIHVSISKDLFIKIRTRTVLKLLLLWFDFFYE